VTAVQAVPALALVPAQAPARAQVLALHPAVPAQVQAPPLQAVPVLVQAHLQAAQAQVPVLAQAPAQVQALDPVQALAPTHPRVNLTVITKNTIPTDQ
jgi:hypothetical protein